MISPGIKKLITLAIEKNASDIHICVGAPILFRIGKDLIPSTQGKVTPELVERYYEWIRHIHVNETDGKHCGAGDYDFGPVLAILKKLNYAGWISLEAFDFSPGAETDLAAWYPGEAYVDIVGQDHYPMDGNHDSAKDVFDELSALTRGQKLIGLGENGPIPDPALAKRDRAGYGPRERCTRCRPRIRPTRSKRSS